MYVRTAKDSNALLIKHLYMLSMFNIWKFSFWHK